MLSVLQQHSSVKSVFLLQSFSTHIESSFVIGVCEQAAHHRARLLDAIAADKHYIVAPRQYAIVMEHSTLRQEKELVLLVWVALTSDKLCVNQ